MHSKKNDKINVTGDHNNTEKNNDDNEQMQIVKIMQVNTFYVCLLRVSGCSEYCRK